MKMITKNMMRVACCLLVAAFWACSSEEQIPAPGPEDPSTGTDSEVTLRIKFPSEGSSASTKALTDPQEKQIDNLRVFAFKQGSGSRSADVFLYEITGVSTPEKADIDNDSVWVTTLSVQKTTDIQRLVLVANLSNDMATLGTMTAGTTTIDDLFNNITIASSFWQTSLTEYYKRFPMWGQMATGLNFSSTSVTEIDVNMFRTMARVDVGVDMDNASSTLASAFKISEVSVYARPKSYLTPHADYMGSASGIAEEVFTKPRPVNDAITSHTYTVTGQRSLIRTIYIPEADATTSATPQSYLIIKGTWASGQWNGKTGYYRVDFADGTNFIPIIRNHAYRINITKVNTLGYGTKAEAEAATPGLSSEDLVVENVNDNINEIVYNDTDWLGINASTVLFDWDKTLVGNATAATADKAKFVLKMLSTYSSWTVEGSASWLTLSPTSGSFITDQVSDLTIAVKDDGENLTGTERSATLTLRAGMLSIPITIRQSGGANSHLIRFETGNTTATIKLPVAFAREAAGGTLSLTNARARVLWHETKESIPVTFSAELSSDQNYVTVTATSNGTQFSGNAVIALLDGSGIGWVGSDNPANVLWSWHVWSMDGSADMDANFHDPNRDRLMRQTMGKYAGNNGMFYQWGRKDPFPQYTTHASPRVISVEATSLSTEADVIKTPTTFYTGNHWLTGTVPATRWTAGSKSEYNDPCPTGWRVPQASDSNEWTIPSAAGDYQNGLISGSAGSWATGSNYLWIATGTNYSYWTGGTTVSDTPSTSATTTPGANIRCVKDIKLVK